MEKYKFKNKKLILSVFGIIILFLFTFNVTSSRYMRTLMGEKEDVVAVPILNLDNTTFNYTLKNMLPGDVDESDFYVNNYESEKTNEVLMKYYLKVKMVSEIPVTITLSSEDGTVLALTDDGQTEEFRLPYDEELSTKFHIKVDWNKSYNNYEYAGKDIELTVDLVATQVTTG